MFRTFTVIVIACLTFGLAGCRFCASPYDYCSPTFTGNNYEFYHGNPCHPNYASGSRFLGTEEVCRSGHCNTCGDYSPSGCSSCEIEHNGLPVMEEASVPVTKVTKPNVKSLPASVKKVPTPPPPPASQAIAVPQTIPGASALKNVQAQQLSAPRPTVPQTNYAKQAVQNLADSDFDPNQMLSELKELDPDAVEVKIIGFE